MGTPTDAEVALLSLIVALKLIKLGYPYAAAEHLGCGREDVRMTIRSRLSMMELPEYQDCVDLLMRIAMRRRPNSMPIDHPFSMDRSAHYFVMENPHGATKESVARHFKLRPSVISRIEMGAIRKMRKKCGGMLASSTDWIPQSDDGDDGYSIFTQDDVYFG